MSIASLDGLNRRRFLQASAAATLGLASLPAFAAEEKKTDEFGGFILGAQSYTFRNFKLEPALKQIHGLGLHYVEFYNGHVPLNSSPEQIKAILKLCKDYEITPVAYGVEPFSKNHDENKKRFELGKALGIKALSADPNPDAFDSLDKLCEEYGIAIAIHPHGPNGKNLHRWYSAEIIMDAVKNHHKLIGSCLDTGHLIRSAQPPFNKKLDSAEQVLVMGDRNFGMHLKDHDNEHKTDVVFGKGVLNVASVLKALKKVGFKGHLSIEYEAHADNPSPDTAACVEVFKKAVKEVS